MIANTTMDLHPAALFAKRHETAGRRECCRAYTDAPGQRLDAAILLARPEPARSQAISRACFCSIPERVEGIAVVLVDHTTGARVSSATAPRQREYLTPARLDEAPELGQSRPNLSRRALARGEIRALRSRKLASIGAMARDLNTRALRALDRTVSPCERRKRLGRS